MVVECISSIYPILSILPVGYSKIACPGIATRCQGTTTVKTMKMITAGQTLLPMDVDVDVDVEEEDRGMVAESQGGNQTTPINIGDLLDTTMTTIVTEAVVVNMIHLLMVHLLIIQLPWSRRGGRHRSYRIIHRKSASQLSLLKPEATKINWRVVLISFLLRSL